MSCLPCFGGAEKEKEKKNGSMKGTSSAANSNRDNISAAQKQENHKHKNSPESVQTEASNGNIQAQTFTFRELATATKNFTPDCLLGEGGFGRVYKGCLESNGQIVAVKQLDRNGFQGNKEFMVEVLMLSLLHHPNLVNLIGYCADGDQRLLVYEFMPQGSLEDHLLDLSPQQMSMDWYTRMKIAFGAAQGIEYLHDKANPPVIYRDLKSSNILLDDSLTPKLSDFGLAKLGPMGEKNHVSSRVMGTYGYCAPEYARTGHLTPKSDVYSFGVVLLELITGRRAIDTMKPTDEQNLLTWAQPMFKDQKRFPELVDLLLKDNYPAKGLNQAVAVAAMCLQDEATVRPLMADVVVALSFLIDAPPAPPPPVETLQLRKKSARKVESDAKHAGTGPVLRHRGSSSRRGSRSSSRRDSRHGSDDGSRHSSGSSSRHGSDDGSSSSRHSRGSTSSMHGSLSLRHGSTRSVPNRGFLHGSGGASSKHSEDEEYDYEHES